MSMSSSLPTLMVSTLMVFFLTFFVYYYYYYCISLQLQLRS